MALAQGAGHQLMLLVTKLLTLDSLKRVISKAASSLEAHCGHCKAIVIAPTVITCCVSQPLHC